MPATANTTNDDAASEFWLYGYGKVPGWVNGYVRRFWQVGFTLCLVLHHGDDCLILTFWLVLSEDHRGTPEAPGRVVTLIERSYWEKLTDHHDSAPEKVWGVAYRIVPEKVSEVKEYLDIREINGYSIHYTPFYPADGSTPMETLVYIGTPDNEQFVGPQDPQKLAQHILNSKGPSGLNRDYLYGLDTALNELSPDSGDYHVSDLARRVRALEHSVNGTSS
ncbi:putative glutathione-specific gamma-glutamylcyclotransferase 2 [Metarhizium anisopliae]|nr:putative glutathione-specific gamma-glutamylcyclotransferase 2 [Metarhizium anisopliae]